MKPLVEIRSSLAIDFEARLNEFSYESNDRAKDRARFTLDNRDRQLINWYPPGATAAVRWGYPGNVTPWRIIQFKDITGFRRLTIEANGLEAVLDRTERTAAYSGTRSSIVQEIVERRYGFSGRLLHVEETTDRVDVINQMAETDAVFLKRLATEEGFVFYIDHTGLHWHAPRYDSAPIRIYTYYGPDDTNQIIGEPRFDFDLLRHYRRVKKKSLDPTNKNIEEDTVDVTTDTDAKELGVKATTDGLYETTWKVSSTGEPERVKEFNSERAWTIVDQRARETENPELMTFAQAWKQDPEIAKTVNPKLLESLLEASEKIMAHGSATKKKRALAAVNIGLSFDVIGDPSLWSGEVIRCLGFSDIVDGNFYLKKSTHKVANGYQCSLVLRKHNPEKNPKRGKMENTGAEVNEEEQTGEAKPRTIIDEKGRVYTYPPGFVGPV